MAKQLYYSKIHLPKNITGTYLYNYAFTGVLSYNLY